MNWKKPKTKIFFVPVPYTGQKLFELTEYKRNPEAPFIKMEFTDTDTKEIYTCAILDYLGIYDVNAIPDWIARLTTDLESITGHQLIALLKKRLPEFKKSELVLFYQLSKI